MKVCIDPGHNSTGKDTGAEGYGLKEQDITLILGRKVRELLIGYGVTVVMTRDGDNAPSTATVETSLSSRVALSNAARADYFISIHTNASDTHSGTGSEVFALKAGGEGEKLASVIAPKLAIAGLWANRGVKFGNLQVLRDTDAPAVLCECGFIDYASDAVKLKDDVYLQRIAKAIADGFAEYKGLSTINQPPTSEPVNKVPVTSTPPKGDNITPLNGDKGWDEYTEDGRRIIHATNYAYLTIGTDGSVWSYGPNRDAIKLA
ncbi:MAG: N-acetylmuramoyl-L-alanine amidase [Peptococcaceae bacterium]|jgi:N-acetylmuramoyl-L-alanine amidase|nr:N-acetylmuramoyl-L-alanine amidase [Peptococcaceae bacterium]